MLPGTTIPAAQKTVTTTDTSVNIYLTNYTEISAAQTAYVDYISPNFTQYSVIDANTVKIR